MRHSDAAIMTDHHVVATVLRYTDTSWTAKVPEMRKAKVRIQAVLVAQNVGDGYARLSGEP